MNHHYVSVPENHPSAKGIGSSGSHTPARPQEVPVVWESMVLFFEKGKATTESWFYQQSVLVIRGDDGMINSRKPGLLQ